MLRCLPFLLVFLIPALAHARTQRVDQIPNGNRYGCTSCHTSAAGGGQFTRFGSDCTTALLGEGTVDTRDQDWSQVYALDSDKDGWTNGEELGDPNGEWRIGDPNPPGAITNPGDQAQHPPSACGDGRVTNPEEECEGTNLNGLNCKLLGLDDGELSCTEDCLFDKSGCGEPLADVGGDEDAGSDPGVDDGGGGCCSTSSSNSSLLPILLFFAVVVVRRRRRVAFFLIVAALSACGTDSPVNPVDAGSDSSNNANNANNLNNVNNQNNVNNLNNLNNQADVGVDMPMTSCLDQLQPADRDRKVVIAHPFVPSFEVLELSATGTLSETGRTFVMGEGNEGNILFTPDGTVGYVAQDDGTLGVFRFNGNGEVEVVNAGFDPGFYVSGLATIRGDKIYAWETGFRDTDNDPNTPDGGLYEIPIECTAGVPMTGSIIAPAKLIWNVDASGDTWVLAATDLLDDETENSAQLYDPIGNARIASAQLFPDTDFISAGVARTKDDSFVLVGDNSVFSAAPSRIGVGSIGNGVLTPVQVIDVPDPVVIVTSPYNNAALVLSTVADTLNVLRYDPANAVTPFSPPTALAVNDASLLPIAAASVERGSLVGTTLISENVAVRVVRFEANGTVTDVQFLPLASAVANGAIGIQP